MTTYALEIGVATIERVRRRDWILGWWLVGRAVVFGAAALLHVFGPRALAGLDERRHLFGVLGAWDGRWYRLVAGYGYLLEPGRQSDPAFFPLLPLCLRGLRLLGIGPVTGGILLANVAFLCALYAFESLTRALFDERFARRATVYLSIFPIGVVFSMAYPESLVLLAICVAALAALRGHWLLVTAVMAAAALARPEALFISLPLAGQALHERRRRGLAYAAVAAPFAGLASFALYLGWAVHDPLAWTHAERAWGRHFTPLGIVHAIARIPALVAGNAWLLRDIVFFAVYAIALAAAYRVRVPRAWVVSAALILVLPLCSGSFDSVSRFGLLAPAVFWGLAALGERRPIDRGIRVASVTLLAGAMFSLPYVFP